MAQFPESWHSDANPPPPSFFHTPGTRLFLSAILGSVIATAYMENTVPAWAAFGADAAGVALLTYFKSPASRLTFSTTLICNAVGLLTGMAIAP